MTSQNILFPNETHQGHEQHMVASIGQNLEILAGEQGVDLPMMRWGIKRVGKKRKEPRPGSSFWFIPWEQSDTQARTTHRSLPPTFFINIFTSEVFHWPSVLLATVSSVLPIVCRAASDIKFEYCGEIEFASLRIMLSKSEALENAEL